MAGKSILWSWSYCLIFLINAWILLVQPSDQKGLNWSGKSYLDNCSEDDPCIATKWLSCQNGQCKCMDEKELIYDPLTDQCAAIAGYSCLRKLPSVESKSDESQQNEILNDEESYYINCIKNAKCTYPEDICQCDFRYYQTNNRSCLPQHAYGERCSSDDQCDKFRYFSCVAGRCTCDRDHRYDRKHNKCFKPVGEPCTVIDYLDINDEYLKGDECPEDSSCIDGVCKCNADFLPTSDRTCGKGYGSYCNVEIKCSDVQFACRNERCDCKYPLHQFYDKELGECVSLVNGPCSSVIKGPSRANGLKRVDPDLHFIQKCVNNSICKEGRPFNFCECKSGYVETNKGECVKAYGADCKKDSECDEVPPLSCVQNKCQCTDALQIYDEKHRKCIGLAGSRCHQEDGSTSGACAANAFCYKQNPQLHFGKCVCIRPAVLSADRSCRK